MDNKRNITEELKQLIKDNFVQTEYNKNENTKYVEETVKLIFQKFEELLDDKLNVIKTIESDISIFPSIQEVDGIEHMQNIGISASLFLDYIKWNPDAIDSEVYNVVFLFLQKVGEMARNKCKTDDANCISTPYPTSLVINDLKEFEENFKAFIADANVSLKRLRDEAKDASDQAKDNAKIVSDKAEEARKSADNAATISAEAKLSLDSSQKTLNDAKQQNEMAQKAVRLAAIKLKKAEKAADGIIPNMLTILGIFVGVIVAVVACYLTILLTKNDSEAISTTSIPLGFMFAWMMGHILALVIFLLLYLTAKITDRTLACRCKEFEEIQKQIQQQAQPQTQQTNGQVFAIKNKKTIPDCVDCKKECNKMLRFKSRFPYLYWINILFVAGYIVLGVVHIVDQYYAQHLNPWIYKNPFPFFLILLIGPFVAILVIRLVCKLVLFIKKKLCSKKGAKTQ